MQRSSSVIASIITLVAVAGPLAPGVARAQWRPDAYPTLSGANLPVPDGAGGILVGNNNSGLLHVDGAGHFLPVSSGIPLYATAFCSDSRGGIISMAGGGEIYASRLRSNSTLVWSVSLTANPGGQINPAVSTDGAGGVVAAWMDQRNTAGGTNTYDIYAQWVDSAGVQRWTANGVPVCTAANDQLDVAIVSDGAGGAYVVWGDKRPGAVGGSDIYGQHLNALGVSQWAADGIAICSAPGVQQTPVIASDGAGGCYVAWWDARGGDFDVYLQRLNPAGVPAFAANGMPVATGPFDQLLPQLVPDGSNGVFVCWEDHRVGGADGFDIYARRVDGSGAFVWPEIPVCTEPHQQKGPFMIADGTGGVILDWSDNRTPPGYAVTVFAQRLDAAGTPRWAANGVQVAVTGQAASRMTSDGTGGAFVAGSAGMSRILGDGTPAWVANYVPAIASVADVAGDEGGFVRLSLVAPPADLANLPPVPTAYEVWRKIPGSAATAGGASRLASRGAGSAAEPLMSVQLPPGAWEIVGAVFATGSPTYSVVAPTHTDSTAAGPADDTFAVMTITSNRVVYAVSDVAAGHSVDNLAPAPPSMLAGGRTGPATVVLAWAPSSSADLWHYSVYRGDAPGFSTDDAHRIGVPTPAGYTDLAFTAGSYYKVTATDRHGNESPAATLAPNQITGVAPTVSPRESYAVLAGANPFAGRAVIEYGLARAGHVELAIYDVSGRKVATLVDGAEPAGVRRVAWEGAAGSRAGPGVYLARFEAPGISRTLRLVRVE